MNKYDFVLFEKQHRDFLEQLKDLGLVDITTTGWTPADEDRALLQSIELHAQAIKYLTELGKMEDFVPGKPYEEGREAFSQYLMATSNLQSIEGQIAQTERDIEETALWGNFSPTQLEALSKAGVTVKYFCGYSKEFYGNLAKWGEDYDVELINEVDGVVYFVAITYSGNEVLINANQVRAPTTTEEELQGQKSVLKDEKIIYEKVLSDCAASLDLIKELSVKTKDHLQLNQVVSTSEKGADGTLMILEGWATKDSSEKLDAMLEAYPNMVYMKSNPTPVDETPVVLKNNRYSTAFEFIGNFYSPPKYGTMDLTPFFAPFYMIFFGFCLADGGYGLIVLLGGLFLLKKGGEKTKLVAKLSMWCGGATMLFGLMTGSFFGIGLASLDLFVGVKDKFLTTDNLFILALMLGVIQVLFAMGIKVYSLITAFGFKYAVSTLGWLIVLVALVMAMALPMIGLQVPLFTVESIGFYATVGVGFFMMLFFNSPGKNLFINFGAGLWNTYNDITGILSDVLSYLRLFAIGLSGGILAMVFNQLAMGLSPDIPVVKQIVMLLILLIGHGINVFMSILSSFVHPMRLTFVEFYKNAGFEAGQRRFSPMKRYTE